MKITLKSLAGMIDSTLLKNEASEDELRDLCAFAKDNDIFAVCVYPEQMDFVFSLIKKSKVRLDGVAGFPHGTDSSGDKWRQAEQRIQAGADEIDMVMNIGMFLDKRYNSVINDIQEVVLAARNTKMRRKQNKPVLVKVIIESAALEDEEKRLSLEPGILIKDASKIIADADADFVKTSTGMHESGGVRENHVKWIKSVLRPGVKVKAAGGIKTWDHVNSLLHEGADRFGTSSAKVILDELRKVLEQEKKEFVEISD